MESLSQRLAENIKINSIFWITYYRMKFQKIGRRPLNPFPVLDTPLIARP